MIATASKQSEDSTQGLSIRLEMWMLLHPLRISSSACESKYLTSSYLLSCLELFGLRSKIGYITGLSNGLRYELRASLTADNRYRANITEHGGD